VTSSPRNYNDPNINDYPLTGDYNAFGVQCRPAFQIFKDKLKDYLPEKVSVITTISAETIRKVAKELVSAAEIGKTVQLEGQVYPLRQAAIQWYRGAHPSNHSFNDNFAYKMINLLLGNIDMPGGH